MDASLTRSVMVGRLRLKYWSTQRSQAECECRRITFNEKQRNADDIVLTVISQLSKQQRQTLSHQNLSESLVFNLGRAVCCYERYSKPTEGRDEHSKRHITQLILQCQSLTQGKAAHIYYTLFLASWGQRSCAYRSKASSIQFILGRLMLDSSASCGLGRNRAEGVYRQLITRAPEASPPTRHRGQNRYF